MNRLLDEDTGELYDYEEIRNGGLRRQNKMDRAYVICHMAVSLDGKIDGDFSSRWQCIVSLYRSLIIAMIGGRVIWGMVRAAMLGMTGSAFTWQMFMAGAFLNAVPGIILQLVFIPALMVALNKTGIVRFHREQKAAVKAGQGI